MTIIWLHSNRSTSPIGEKCHEVEPLRRGENEKAKKAQCKNVFFFLQSVACSIVSLLWGHFSVESADEKRG